MLKSFAATLRLLLAMPLLIAALVSTSRVAVAQEVVPKNELAATIGRTFISDQRVPNTNFFDNTVHSGKGLSLDFLYARQLKFFKWGAVGVELPIIYNPDEDLNYGLNIIPKQYSSLFATPALRVSLFRNFIVSPWVSLGGGVGYFASSKDAVFFGPYTGHRIKATGVMHGGIGFDVPFPGKLHDLVFRFEARDNWSGVPAINVNTGRTRQHNYYVGGGVVYRF